MRERSVLADGSVVERLSDGPQFGRVLTFGSAHYVVGDYAGRNVSMSWEVCITRRQNEGAESQDMYTRKEDGRSTWGLAYIGS